MVRKGSEAGFTLVEALIVVALTATLATMGASLLLQGNRFFMLTRTRLDLQKQARGTMYVMTREIRQAQSNSIVIDRVSASQPYYSRITFTKQQGTPMMIYQNGNLLCLATNASAVTLTVGGNLVCKTSGGGQAQTLSKNLQYMAFTFPRSDDMTILSVSMTIQSTIYQGRTKALHMASEKVQIMD